MCPESEFQDPHRPKSNFERNQSGKMFEFLAVKRYKKSSAGLDDMNDPACVRSPVVLYHTMMYMIEVLVDQDLVPPGQSFFMYQNQGISDIDTTKATHDFTTIYSYLKDRTRQISQDLTFNK